MTVDLLCHNFSVKSKDGLSLRIIVFVELSAAINDQVPKDVFVKDGVVRLTIANSLTLLDGRDVVPDARRTAHITHALHDFLFKVRSICEHTSTELFML